MERTIPGRATGRITPAQERAAALASADDVRPDVREPEPRKERKRKGSAVIDPFQIPAERIPTGVTYEWKRLSTMGKEDPSYMMGLQENGWDPVPADRHKEYMPQNYKGTTIERDGLILMERPAYLTEEARAEDDYLSRQQIRDKEQQLALTPKDQLDRTTPKLSKSYEAMPVPEE